MKICKHLLVVWMIAMFFFLCAFTNAHAQQPTRSIVRYGALFNFHAREWQAVVGGKIEEIDLGWKRIANPEVWAAGATNSTDSAFSVVLAEPWYLTSKVTIFPLGSASFTDKRLHFGLGIAVQFQVLKF